MLNKSCSEPCLQFIDTPKLSCQQVKPSLSVTFSQQLSLSSAPKIDRRDSDLLHALQGVAFHHGISASSLRGFTPHSHRNRRYTGGSSRFDSRDRAMARSHRLHLRPSHRQTCVLWDDSLRRSSRVKYGVQSLKRTAS